MMGLVRVGGFPWGCGDDTESQLLLEQSEAVTLAVPLPDVLLLLERSCRGC